MKSCLTPIPAVNFGNHVAQQHILGIGTVISQHISVFVLVIWSPWMPVLLEEKVKLE